MKCRQSGIWKRNSRSFTVAAERSEAGLGAGVRARAPGRCQVPEAGRRQWRRKRGEPSMLGRSTPAARLTGTTDTAEATAGGVAPGKLRAGRCERPSSMCTAQTGICRQWWATKVVGVTNSLGTGEDHSRLLDTWHSSWKPKRACVQSLSHIQRFVTPWTGAHRAPLPMGFYWQNTGVSCHALLQGTFPTQGSNLRLLCLLHCRQILYRWATGEAQKPEQLRNKSPKLLSTENYS